MPDATLQDVQAYARLQLAFQNGMTRGQYIEAVRAYATEIHGQADDVKLMAERTARYMWARRSLAKAYDDLGAAQLLDKPESFGG